MIDWDFGYLDPIVFNLNAFLSPFHRRSRVISSDEVRLPKSLRGPRSSRMLDHLLKVKHVVVNRP